MVFYGELRLLKGRDWCRHCRLFADDTSELLKFGRKIGLNPKWLRMEPKPHFILLGKMIKRAKEAGAVRASLEQEKWYFRE